MDLSNFISTISKHESTLLGADLNRHAGQKRDGANNCHCNHKHAIRNEEGERILSCAVAYDIMVISTLKRKMNFLSPSPAKGQDHKIDFQVFRRNDLKNIVDWKVILGKRCLTQHRTLLPKLDISPKRQKCSNQRNNQLLKARSHTKSRPRTNELFTTGS